jgi:hypothetical protein
MKGGGSFSHWIGVQENANNDAGAYLSLKQKGSSVM